MPHYRHTQVGYAAAGLLRWNFRLEQWGTGKLFINRNAPPYLVVRTRDTFVVVNFTDPSQTRDLYDKLSGPGQGQKPGAQLP